MTSRPGDLTLGLTATGLVVSIHVTPRARRPGVGGMHGGALRVAVCEPPEEGRANEACLRALAEVLGLRPSAVELEAGSRGRRKRVRIAGDPELLERRVRELAGVGPRPGAPAGQVDGR